MSDPRQWIVTTTGERPLAELVPALERAGLRVHSVLDAIGCVTGSTDEAGAAALRSVPGVSDVSPDQAIDIGPPDAPTTW